MLHDLCQLLWVWTSRSGAADSDSKAALKHAASKSSQFFALDQRQILLQSSEPWEQLICLLNEVHAPFQSSNSMYLSFLGFIHQAIAVFLEYDKHQQKPSMTLIMEVGKQRILGKILGLDISQF